MKKKKIPWSTERGQLLAKYDKALRDIAKMGDNLHPVNIDWANIGKNAKSIAKEAITPKCQECGK